ncbi:uncharacterized protein J8A68_005771 [[Candida] subhashii]|uniref:Uncharacterized protein n=1 Tax=[Candida] subhashii TaxID=561895 RepID=A0A8J5QE10_9ASCO|nr:uncharacterized protein J8A68_005771 [[Candida] subhashii]KAG7660654.1 hypothetical protein J8A68_005771 [[Candida] subhashii]
MSLRRQLADLSASLIFLEYEYIRIKKLFSKEFRSEYLELMTKDNLTEEKISQIVDDFDKLIKCTYELSAGFEVLQEIWYTIFRKMDANPSTEILQRAILEKRDDLSTLLLVRGKYSIYKDLMLIVTAERKFNLTPSETDFIIGTIQLEEQTKPDEELREKGPYRPGFMYNDVAITQALESNISIELKRKLLNTLIRSTFFLSRDTRMQTAMVREFLRLSNLIEQRQWFTDPDFNSYDECLDLISYIIGKISPREYLRSLVGICQQVYGDRRSGYILITRLMKILIPKCPHYVTKYFEFKRLMIDFERIDPNVLVCSDDLTSAMTACLSTNNYKYFEQIYAQHPHLHSREQEALILEFLLYERNWEGFQTRFQELYENGSFPNIAEYGVTMRGLNILRADKQIRALFQEISKRGLKQNSTIYGLLMESYSRKNEQISELLEEYISLCKAGKAEIEGIKDLVVKVLEQQAMKNDIQQLVKLLKIFLDREKTDEFPMISEQALKMCIGYAVEALALKEMEEIKGLITEYDKLSANVYESIIRGYTSFGQFEKADRLCFEAHGASKTPFSEGAIYVTQIDNAREWRKNATDTTAFNFIGKRIYYLESRLKGSRWHVLLRHEPRYIREILRIKLEIEDSSKARGVLRRMIKFKRYEFIFLPFLQFQRKWGKEKEIIKSFSFMNNLGVTVTGPTYFYALATSLKIDNSVDDEFQNSKKFFKQILQSYGIAQAQTRDPKLSLRQDAVDVAKCIQEFISYIGDPALPVLDVFALRLKEVYGIIPFQIRSMIYGCRKPNQRISQKIKNRIPELCFDPSDDAINVYKKFVEQYPYNDEVIVIPPLLQQEVTKAMISRLDSIQGEISSESAHQLAEMFINAMSNNLYFAQEEYIKIFKFICKFRDFKYFNDLLQICEEQLAYGSLEFMHAFYEKRHCYSVCLAHKTTFRDPKEIDMKFQVYSDFYNTNASKSLEYVKAIGIKDFPRSRHGRLFPIKSEYVKNVSMAKWRFLRFFNPGRVPKYLLIDKEMKYLLNEQLEFFCQGNSGKTFALADKYPDTLRCLIAEPYESKLVGGTVGPGFSTLEYKRRNSETITEMYETMRSNKAYVGIRTDDKLFKPSLPINMEGRYDQLKARELKLKHLVLSPKYPAQYYRAIEEGKESPLDTMDDLHETEDIMDDDHIEVEEKGLENEEKDLDDKATHLEYREHNRRLKDIDFAKNDNVENKEFVVTKDTKNGIMNDKEHRVNVSAREVIPRSKGDQKPDEIDKDRRLY